MMLLFYFWQGIYLEERKEYIARTTNTQSFFTEYYLGYIQD